MEQLTMVTDEAEYAPVSSEAEEVKTKLVCGKCGADWIPTSSPAICPVCGQDSYGIAVPASSEFHELMLHAVAEMYGPGGIVVDEERAKATSCECVEYKPDKFWCTSKGVVGALTDEQEKIYCNPRIMVERPAIKERMEKWQACVTKSREAMPPTDGRTRLEVYLKSMSECLAEAGVKT